MSNQLEIFDVNQNAQGIAKLNGKVVFVNNTLPGDLVEYEIIKENKNFSIAKVLKYLKNAPSRIESACDYFSECGGCQFQHWNYSDETSWKEKSFQENLKRIAKIKDAPVNPILTSSMNNYRNHVRLFVKKNKIGFYKNNSNEIVPISKCIVAMPEVQPLLEQFSNLFETNHENHIHEIEIKMSNFNKEILVILKTNKKKIKYVDFIVNDLKINNPQVVSIYHCYNSQYQLLHGKDYLEESLMNFKIHFGPKSFYQKNIYTVELLFKKAIEMAELNPEQRVVDAYSGVGIIGLLASRIARQVTCVETGKESVEFMAENVYINQIENIQVIHGACEDWLFSNPEQDLIFVDPPRKGLSRDMIEAIIQSAVSSIIYISCDSATLSRDIYILTQNGFRHELSQPIDQFPRTHHLESITKIVRV